MRYPSTTTGWKTPLIQSAKLNGHDPYTYLKDVLIRLPMQKNNAIVELLPHNWKPATPDKA